VVHTDARFAAAIEEAVGEIEAHTDAEIVVVAAPASGSYRDLAWGIGALTAGVTLAFLCWSPIDFDARWFPVDVAAIGMIVGSALARYPRAVIALAGDTRRRRQVREAANAAFTEENVHATVGRTGLLVYVSAGEAMVELLPDQGLLGQIPGAAWNGLAVRADDLATLVAGLHRVGTLLARHVPPTADNPDQIANAPRVRA
jgi:putative membrane protein